MPPDASLDAVIAMQGAPGHVEFRGKPAWADGPYDGGVNSIWDLGEAHVRYAAPAVLQEVGRQGQLGGRLVDGGSVFGTAFGEGEGNCNDRMALPAADKPLPGFAPLKYDELLVALHLPKALPAGKVEILGRKRRAIFPASPYAASQVAATPRSFLVHEIDLDRDGVADVAVFELLDEDGSVPTEHSMRYQFLNIDGRWWFAGIFEIDECA